MNHTERSAEPQPLEKALRRSREQRISRDHRKQQARQRSAPAMWLGVSLVHESDYAIVRNTIPDKGKAGTAHASFPSSLWRTKRPDLVARLEALSYRSQVVLQKLRR